MSHPLFFRGVTYFYPIGNTSAVRLTEHLPPEQQANVLLLACGDPRHVLYTVYTNETNSGVAPQKLDVTCCDLEVAVLARDAILFTLLADEDAQEKIDLIWNIFYHFMLDQESLSLLIGHCHKLSTLSKDLESWNAGPYARFLTMCDKRTLEELHQFWSLYIATTDYTPDRTRQFQKGFLDGMKKVNKELGDGLVITSSRSAGPLLPLAVEAAARQFRKFWSTGITDDGFHSTEQAKFVNPTFAFSAEGDKFAVHYGVDPVAGFHLAEVIASSRGETPVVLAQRLVQGARSQFSQWCTSVIKLLRATSMMSSSLLVIRMFAGDALMLCHALSYLNSYGVTATSISSSPWKASRIEFEENQYGKCAQTPAPTMFNVIDTSNISDHVGLLNLLVVATPILCKSPSAALYTETLLSKGDAPSTAILERLCGDMQTMSLLLGIIPSAFLSRFTTRSNVHETLLQELNSLGTQYHERVAWKAICNEHLISVAPDQLGRLLFGVYLTMFSDENMARQLQNINLSSTRAFQEQTLVHYTRRSFVQLLNRIKPRVQTDWIRVMETFDDEVVRDTSLILGSNFYQEMCGQLYLLDVSTFTSMEQSYIRDLRVKTNPAIFRDWESIPAVVTVVLVIPREKIRAVESELRLIGTPVLLCEVRNASLWNSFAYISAAYGKLETAGAGQMKTARIVEEKEGVSPLIVFFSAPSSSLMLSYNATVGFRTRPSPRISLTPLLIEAICTAPLEDSRHVHILAQPPSPLMTNSAAHNPPLQVAQEHRRVVSAQMNASCTEISSFLIRVDITDPAGQASLAAGSTIKIEDTWFHGTRLRVDKYTENIYFPLPVDTAKTKFRVARKSMYIEVIAPPALSMQTQNERRITKRFFAALDGTVPTAWNVHRVNLDRCTPFKPSEDPEASKWLVPHVSLMFSLRERAARERESSSREDTLVNLKDSIHTLLLSAAGIQGPVRPIFALQNTSTRELLAFIFVAGLRLDVGSHTIVTDAWVAPGTPTVQDKLNKLDVRDVIAIKLDSDESEAWRYLLPLLVERCRTWTHRPSCEYLTHGAVPLYPGAGADPEKSPFCSCGVGIGTETLPHRFKSLTCHVARVAISPLFAVPYLEKVGMIPGTPADRERCRACGKQEGPLSLCGRCKGVRYCSKKCQVNDWKSHKKTCVQ